MHCGGGMLMSVKWYDCTGTTYPVFGGHSATAIVGAII